MKLHLLETRIDEFISVQLQPQATGWYFPHSIVDHFHRAWTQTDLSLKEKYDLALRSDISRRWWKRENYRPREIMLNLITTDEELAGIAFNDLFNDASLLGGRISRFNFYAEELLQMHLRNNPRAIESYHHQDAGILSLYLAGRFPDKYALYPGLTVFQWFCKKVESPETSVVDDLVRFTKVAAIVFRFLQRHPLYEKLTELRSDENHPVKFLPFQTAFEIISFRRDDIISPAT